MLAATTVAAPAQTFTSLVSFDGADGVNPMYAPLAQGRDRNFYGTTRGAGGNTGTVFKVTAEGKLTTLAFLAAQPYSGLVLATNGSFYGATALGGAHDWGTIFKINPITRELTTVYSFCAQTNCSDGAFPIFGLVQASNRKFYGTTPNAPAVGNPGTIFEITPAGKFTTLHTFNETDAGPSGPLIQASNGNLYGTAGGPYGTVFEITPTGKFKTLHIFKGADGAAPSMGLLQASDGNFYGTTQQGGANNSCPFGCGTVFRMKPKGALKTIYNFCSQANCTDGSDPISGLVQASDGNFYGVSGGGAHNRGTVFKITAAGKLTGCIPMPRNPRLTCPFSSNSFVTRFTVDAGIAMAMPRASPEVFRPTTCPCAFTSALPEKPI